jgi:hypothetical protein
MASIDQGASQRRGNDNANNSPVGQGSTLSPKSSSGETYYDPLGYTDGFDIPSAGRFKTPNLTPIGGGPIVTGNNMPSAFEVSAIFSPFGTTTSSGPPATVVTYKLRARDSACGSPTYVEWTTTTTPLTVASFPGPLPCGGPLVELTVLSQK